MSGYANTTSKFDTPRFGHAWRDTDGCPHASVEFGLSWLTFDSPETARAAAAACNQAADAMEALPPAPEGGQS